MKEWTARLAVLFIILGLPTAALGYQYALRDEIADGHVYHIKAASPSEGGFSPASIRVPAGEEITLRFSSTDVTHGIAIGPGLGIDLGHVDPGHVEEFTHTFTEPGTYTYYCNTWCGPDHWRMRGVIEVYDPADPNRLLPSVQADPVIAALAAEGVDIDANLSSHAEVATEHSGSHNDEITLSRTPSAQRGQTLIAEVNIPAEFNDLNWRRTKSPVQALRALLEQNPSVSADDLADVVMFLWSSERPTPDAITIELYNKNCAACHGIDGSGNGINASDTTEPPAAFADQEYMFTMRDDVLYAKIRRGGMGTDMPNFGTLFTQEETWALVDYLRQFGQE